MKEEQLLKKSSDGESFNYSLIYIPAKFQLKINKDSEFYYL